MSVSPAKAVALLTKRLELSAKERRRLAVEIRQALPALTDLLVGEFGVRQVILFGSVARGRAHSDTDVDLAVEGLAPERYFEALARCSDVAGRNVDLVPMEEAIPELLRIIRTKGEVLYAG